MSREPPDTIRGVKIPDEAKDEIRKGNHVRRRFIDGEWVWTSDAPDKSRKVIKEQG